MYPKAGSWQVWSNYASTAIPTAEDIAMLSLGIQW